MNFSEKFPGITRALVAAGTLLHLIRPSPSGADGRGVEEGRQKIAAKEVGNSGVKVSQVYEDRLAPSESGGSYHARNSDGCLGKWQFCKSGLWKIGLKDRSGRWTDYANGMGIENDKDFLNNPAVQDWAFNQLLKAHWGGIVDRGLDKYVGSNIRYKGNEYEITAPGLLCGAHLGGVGGVTAFLVNRSDRSDSNGTHVSKYIFQCSNGTTDVDVNHFISNPDFLRGFKIPKRSDDFYQRQESEADRIIKEANRKANDAIGDAKKRADVIMDKANKRVKDALKRADERVRDATNGRSDRGR